MTSAKSVANAVGGKTARACDSCITKRARWYCAADDAFLCQACDSSVHSANSLARRHERVRLKTASFRSNTDASDDLLNRGPTWHHGFTKKARTPRHGKQHYSAGTRTRNPFHLVPEVGYLDEANSNSHEENEDQLLYRVPIFEPFVAELCSTPSSVTSTELGGGGGGGVVENKRSEKESLQLMQGLLPSDIELAEFAADVESLLGRGLENECIGMEELGLIDHTDNKHEGECCVKVKEEEEEETAEEVVASKDQVVEMGKESSFVLNFDYETCEIEGKEKVGLGMENGVGKEEKENDSNNNGGKRKISLQLDYEAVIIAWASQKCPWTTGDKPNLDPDDEAWPHCMGTCGTEVHYPYGGFGCHPAMADGGREARVSRYREKRRTRLFSKKIRYEVRKLNAEKRPRMKGRFVKRASFAAPTFPLLNK